MCPLFKYRLQGKVEQQQHIGHGGCLETEGEERRVAARNTEAKRNESLVYFICI